MSQFLGILHTFSKFHTFPQRNPEIKLYALPWGFPGWIGQGHHSPWTNVNVTADYIVRWINGAKVHHNLTIDYVGVSENCDVVVFPTMLFMAS